MRALTVHGQVTTLTPDLGTLLAFYQRRANHTSTNGLFVHRATTALASASEEATHRPHKQFNMASISELKKRARELDIETSGLEKRELVTAIEEATTKADKAKRLKHHAKNWKSTNKAMWTLNPEDLCGSIDIELEPQPTKDRIHAWRYEALRMGILTKFCEAELDNISKGDYLEALQQEEYGAIVKRFDEGEWDEAKFADEKLGAPIKSINMQLELWDSVEAEVVPLPDDMLVYRGNKFTIGNWVFEEEGGFTVKSLKESIKESEMDRRRQHGYALNHVFFEGLNHVGDGPDGPVYATKWGS